MQIHALATLIIINLNLILTKFEGCLDYCVV